MAQNIVKFSNIGAQVKGQPFDLFMTFSSGLLLDPVLTGGTNVVWHWPDGVTTSTGTTPAPALTAPGRYRVSMDDWRDLTAIDATDDALTCLEINGTMSNLATLTLTDNPSLEVDLIVDSIYGYRNSFPAMTVNIGGTCPDVSGQSIGRIEELVASYGHTWTYNNAAFLFTVKTDNTGTSNNDQFTIPLPGSGTYDFTVYYDGQATAHTANTSLTLTFPSGAGTYGVAIVGTFPRLYFNNGGDKLKLTGITQFGDVGWGTTFVNSFYGCSNIASTLPSLPTTLLSLDTAFRGCSSLTGSIPALPLGLTDLDNAFRDGSSFTGNVPTLPSTVSSANSAYRQCTSLDGVIEDQSAADGTLTGVSGMFYLNSNLTGNSEDFWNWTTPPTTIANCYTNCTSLTDYAGIPAAYGGQGDAFEFTVKTDNTGTSNDDQFTIPLFVGETYNFTVWYDGTSTTHTTDSNLTLTFPSGAGTYPVRITGTLPRIYFNNAGDKLKLTGLTQFGDVGWGTDWTRAYYGCANLGGTQPTLPANVKILLNSFRLTGITGEIPPLPSSTTSTEGAYRGITTSFTVASDFADACDGTLTNVFNTFNGSTGGTGNSYQFWDMSTEPTSQTGCYTNAVNFTDYATIPAAYGGGGA